MISSKKIQLIIGIAKNVIARSETTKQSSLLQKKRYCFASLAMTSRIFSGCFFVLLIVSFCLPIFAAEPNEPNTPKAELKFENNIETMSWDIKIGETKEGKSRYYRNPGDIKPTHVAKILLHEEYPKYTSVSNVMNTILDGSISKKFSKQQQEFFKTELAIRVDEPDRIPFYYSTWLYATSEEDARLMVQAYIDGLNILVDKRLDGYKKVLEMDIDYVCLVAPPGFRPTHFESGDRNHSLVPHRHDDRLSKMNLNGLTRETLLFRLEFGREEKNPQIEPARIWSDRSFCRSPLRRLEREAERTESRRSLSAFEPQSFVEGYSIY